MKTGCLNADCVDVAESLIAAGLKPAILNLASRRKPGGGYDRQVKTSVREQLGDPDSLYSHYKRLILIRQANPEIARGEYHALSFQEKGIGGFTSTWAGKSVCVLHNSSQNVIQIDLETLELPFSEINAVIGQGGAELQGSVLTLDGMTSVVLR